MQDDIGNWTNYSSEPSQAEAHRLQKIIGDRTEAKKLLDFGFRPLCYLDEWPDAQPRKLTKPFEVTEADISDENILVDTSTGYRFRYLPEFGGLVFDLVASNNYLDALELRMLAANRTQEFRFDRYTLRTYLGEELSYTLDAKHVHPLTLRVSSRPQLETLLNDLTRLFCNTCQSRRLWLRGQRQEYHLQRSTELSKRIYGSPYEISLLPSAGRFAISNPDKMGFDLAFSGPVHWWKKPFLIWIMRENAKWFSHDHRALDLLLHALSEEDDMKFTQILNALQMNSEIAGLAENILWPEEADDLRQWFFAFMKPHSFGVTLQQYGYITSLLDLTEDLDVALYFTQAAIVDGKMRKQDPPSTRVIYVFAERRSGDFFRHGQDLFWGDNDWVKRLPPRLDRQRAGFLMGSTCRAQNFYGKMIVACIHLDDASIESSLSDDDLFPTRDNDLLYDTLIASRPALEGLY